MMERSPVAIWRVASPAHSPPPGTMRIGSSQTAPGIAETQGNAFPSTTAICTDYQSVSRSGKGSEFGFAFEQVFEVGAT